MKTVYDHIIKSFGTGDVSEAIANLMITECNRTYGTTHALLKPVPVVRAKPSERHSYNIYAMLNPAPVVRGRFAPLTLA